MESGIPLFSQLKKLNSLVESITHELSEDSLLKEDDGYSPGYRFPFRHKEDLGPGPRGYHHKRRHQWDCTDCGTTHEGETFCNCIGIGKNNEGWHKRVVIDKNYKKEYNKEYKHGKYPHWRERRSKRAERGSKKKS